jgi:hypothetical protein
MAATRNSKKDDDFAYDQSQNRLQEVDESEIMQEEADLREREEMREVIEQDEEGGNLPEFDIK